MKMTIELLNKIKSLYDAGNSGLEISRMLKDEISYKSIVILLRADFNLHDYKAIQRTKNQIKINTVPTWFKMAMEGYTHDEMVIAHKQFHKPLPLFDVVPCRCTDTRMCYPHYLDHLANIYLHGIKL